MLRLYHKKEGRCVSPQYLLQTSKLDVSFKARVTKLLGSISVINWRLAHDRKHKNTIRIIVTTRTPITKGSINEEEKARRNETSAKKHCSTNRINNSHPEEREMALLNPFSASSAVCNSLCVRERRSVNIYGWISMIMRLQQGT